eukprot:jgi/Hompol1/4399/HPOL_001049-RA
MADRTQPLGSKPAKSRGYKNLLDVPNVLPPSDFPRPHRKALMETVFNKDIRKRYREARKAAVAAASLAPIDSIAKQVSGDIVLGIDLRVRRAHSNAVAAAIDHPFIPNTRVHSIRPPIKVPENYLARLKDLEPVQKELIRQERMDLKHQSTHVDQSDMPRDLLADCGLRFNSDVAVDLARQDKAKKDYTSGSRLLLNIMWTDWNKEVRDKASLALSDLRQGQPIFEWAIELLKSNDPVKRVDALRFLTYLAVMTKDAVATYLECFNDPYASVRIEACKLACTLGSKDRVIINTLLDKLDDHDYRVRAYAIKEPKNRETLNWALHHDPHPVVRAEAIRAISNLSLITEDQTIKEAVFTLLETDKSDRVKREAERVLVACGLIFSNLLDSDSIAAKMGESSSGAAGAAMGGPGGSMVGAGTGVMSGGAPGAMGVGTPSSLTNATTSNTARITNHSTGPYPHILSGATPEEVDIFLRDSLIGEKELTAAIDQVRNLATKESIMAEVQYVIKSSDDPIHVGLELQAAVVAIMVNNINQII